MNALSEFKQRAWEEVRAKETADAKAVARAENRRKMNDALFRSHASAERMPKITGGIRFLIAAICWYPLAFLLAALFAFFGSILSGEFRTSFMAGGGTADGYAVLGFCLSFLVAWFTPEIGYYVVQQFRIVAVRREAIKDYEYCADIEEQEKIEGESDNEVTPRVTTRVLDWLPKPLIVGSILILILAAIGLCGVRLEKGTLETINAKVTAIKFFASGSNLPGRDERIYRNTFSKSEVTYISWELTLSYNAISTSRQFKIDSLWYSPDGNVFWKASLLAGNQPGWTGSLYNQGVVWGNDTHLRWVPGNYRVELFVEGEKIATGTFEITAN